MSFKKNLTQRDTETYARITAPEHVTASHFSEHKKIEGYYENRDVPDFIGSDRLLREDTLYGTIQMGYDPKRGQSFLFANIKTSIFDTAASRYQRELKEYQMKRVQKTGTSNIAFTSKRRGGSAVILYKKSTLPWSRRTIMPYLRRANMESLEKTMPFLDKSAELRDREEVAQEHKSLGRELAARMAQKKYAEMSKLRARQTELLVKENELSALIYRKDTRQRLFFRRMNFTLDMQKREMFGYYRDLRLGGELAREEIPAAPPDTQGDED
jgi:hypothetical protein